MQWLNVKKKPSQIYRDGFFCFITPLPLPSRQHPCAGLCNDVFLRPGVGGSFAIEECEDISFGMYHLCLSLPCIQVASSRALIPQTLPNSKTLWAIRTSRPIGRTRRDLPWP